MIEGKTGSFGDSYYQMVCDNDIISKFRPLLRSGGYKIRDSDGKICVVTPSMAWETPWHHIAHDDFLDCQRWHSIMFDLFSRTMPPEQAFVPSACQQCWKVVVRPQTLLGLFALMHLQMRLDRPSKCGIEIRPNVFGLYGGYFYNHSLEEGLECYKLIRAEVDDTQHLGEKVPVILKRACTEFESKLGDSSKWEVSPAQLHIETLINKWFVRDDVARKQSHPIILGVHRRWIEYAYMNGDGTYLNFTDGKPLYKPYKTYQHLVKAKKSTRENAFKNFARQAQYGYDL